MKRTIHFALHSKGILITLVIIFALSIQARAELINRGTDSLGNRLIYDSNTNTTWYDYTKDADTWENIDSWASSLTVNFEGDIYDDWQLQRMGPYGLSYFHYTALGNGGSSTDYEGCNTNPLNCLVNTGPFLNLQPLTYWSSWIYGTQGYNWTWNFQYGSGDVDNPYLSGAHGIAVRYGDVGDQDGDGFSAIGGDCDDADPEVNPGMTEVALNGKDDDCDPSTPDVTTGTNVTVSISEIELTFDEVISAGNVSVTESYSLQHSDDIRVLQGEVYNITFTGAFSGNVTVCINYDESAAQGTENNLMLVIQENNDLTNITASLDTASNIICGVTSSLTKVAVVEPVMTAPYTITDLGPKDGASFTGINDNGLITGSRLTGTVRRAFIYDNGTETYLGSLGGTSTVAFEINNSGQVVGRSKKANGDYHAFLYDNGSMTDLGTLGGYQSEARSINNNGQVVGYAYDSNNESRAFLYENGTMTDLGTMTGYSTCNANGINDNGQITGYCGTVPDPGRSWHGYLYENGTMTNIGTLGGENSEAYEINNNGQIVGFSDSSSSSRHAFLYDNGQMKDIGTLGRYGYATISTAYDINDSGQILGYTGTASEDTTAYLYENGRMMYLPTLGGNTISATDINNLGQIVGSSSTAAGEDRLVLWNPIPPDIDNDGDGYTRNQGDCDENDPLEHPERTWYLDRDNDGYTEGTTYTISCTRPLDYKAFTELLGATLDCNDADAALNPSTYWYPDSDGDGYGNPTASVQQCTPPEGYVLSNDDCDDSDGNIYPGGPPVRIVDSPPLYFDTLKNAYAAALHGDTIEVQAIVFWGNHPFRENKTVTIQGGYNCGYSGIEGRTTIKGTTVSDVGLVIIENFIIEWP